MKTFKLFWVMVILGGLLLSACAGAPASEAVPAAGSAGSDKAISEVVFTGAIESMNGDQWTINGQTIKVDPSVLRDGPFVIGDTVKVQAHVAADGSVTAKRVESPSAVDLAEAATSTPEPSATGTSVASNDNGAEAVGAVEAITDTSITLGGQTYSFAPGAEIKGTLEVGILVKLHFITNADGTLSVREVEIADPAQVSNNNSNDDNSNGTNVNDNSSNDNSSDDNSSVNSNDDHGNNGNGNGNSNDDGDNGENGNGNANDDNSNNSNGNG
jgi:hypothetical protein